MAEIQRTSLAEFSRHYLRSENTNPDQPEPGPESIASPWIPENSFAVQVVLGMSKNNRDVVPEDHPARLIG